MAKVQLKSEDEWNPKWTSRWVHYCGVSLHAVLWRLLYTLHWGYYVCGVSLHYPLGVIWMVDKHYSMSFTSSLTFYRQDRGFEQILSAVCPLSFPPDCDKPSPSSLSLSPPRSRQPSPGTTTRPHTHHPRPLEKRKTCVSTQFPKVVPWLLTFCLNAQLGRR